MLVRIKTKLRHWWRMRKLKKYCGLESPKKRPYGKTTAMLIEMLLNMDRAKTYLIIGYKMMDAAKRKDMIENWAVKARIKLGTINIDSMGKRPMGERASCQFYYENYRATIYKIGRELP